MEISWINLTSPWSLTFFISVYTVGYYFIEIIWWESYFCRKKMNDGNHISIKAMHYLFWWLPISIGFAYFFLTKSDLNSLNNLLNSIWNLVAYFSPDKKINWSAYWLIVSIIFFYFVVILLALSKLISRLLYWLIEMYFRNKDFFDTRWLYFFGMFTITFGWLIFFIISNIFWLKEFLQSNYILRYFYIIENIAYYILILVPISIYFIFMKLGLRNKISSTIGVSAITFSSYLFFASIYWVKFNFINTIINYMFDGDLLGSVATGIYYVIVGSVFICFWIAWHYIIEKVSNNIYNQRIIAHWVEFHEAIRKHQKNLKI